MAARAEVVSTKTRQGRAERRLDRERVAQLRLRDSARPDPEWLAWTDGNGIVGASMSERRTEDTLGRSMRARRSRIELGCVWEIRERGEYMGERGRRGLEKAGRGRADASVYVIRLSLSETIGLARPPSFPFLVHILLSLLLPLSAACSDSPALCPAS